MVLGMNTISIVVFDRNSISSFNYVDIEKFALYMFRHIIIIICSLYINMFVYSRLIIIIKEYRDEK